MRASGILLHITSLPSPHGVGTLGREAYAFADFLKASGQTYWQILPLGPTGYGDSPYQTDSTFAGNPYLIDLDLLAEDGLLTKAEIESVPFGDDPAAVDYGALYRGRDGLLRKAFARGRERDRAEVAAFYRENESWLRPYALFTAAKRHFGMKPWIEWEDDDLRLRRDPAALERWEDVLREDREYCIYVQYLFFRQWNALRDYIHKNGIRIIGDVPIYVPLDSADVWAEGEFFQLDANQRPIEVAGVPPDAFTEDGQLWGNPLYDWKKMEKDGFGWWIRRIEGVGKLYDVIRIDHFRGFESYWAVPYGDATARRGRWKKGPGMDLVGVLTSWFHELRFIAEDLGYMTPEVKDLRNFSGFPGMKILQFAFDPAGENDYLPHRIEKNSVTYIGTHDNATARQWLEECGDETLAFAREYLGLNREEGYRSGVLWAGMSCASELFVVQMQDWLDLPGWARMNEPGILGHGNWRWRMEKDALTPALAKKILRMTTIYGRAAPKTEKETE